MIRLLPLLVAALLAACSGKENIRAPAELKDISNPALKPVTLWSASGSSGKFYDTLGLALEPDALFSATQNGEVRALEPGSGRVLWSVRTGARVVSGPSVSVNAVLVGTLDGELIALKRADGTPLWRTRVSSEVMAAPVSDGDVVVVRTVDGRLHGLSAVSGAARWNFDRSVPNLTLRGLSAPLVQDGRAFAGMDNGRLIALATADGQPLWEQVVAAPSGRTELDRLTDIDAGLLMAGREIYAASFGGEVACLDAETGQVLWRRSIKSYSGLTLAGDLLIVSDEAGVVWALDARTGAAAWKNEDLKYRRLSAPAFFGGHVVVGDFEGYLHWLSPADGALVARSRVGSRPIRAPMVAATNSLYVLDSGGRVSAVGLQP